tara:strand:- start:718 stop:987 length:270 start_codon:yes stop_codon:yes gene_type:complete
MRIRQVGKQVHNTHEKWREYIENQQQIIVMKSKIKPAIDNLKDKLDSISNEFLGERGLYHHIDILRKKTNLLRDDIISFLKLKQFLNNK